MGGGAGRFRAGAALLPACDERAAAPAGVQLPLAGQDAHGHAVLPPAPGDEQGAAAGGALVRAGALPLVGRGPLQRDERGRAAANDRHRDELVPERAKVDAVARDARQREELRHGLLSHDQRDLRAAAGGDGGGAAGRHLRGHFRQEPHGGDGLLPVPGGLREGARHVRGVLPPGRGLAR